LTEQLQSRATRRTVVATGAKLAYAAPIVAASLKVSAINAFAVSGGGICEHSTGANGGCKGACTKAGFTGNKCNPICGNGQNTGVCPVGQGSNNRCCNAGYCDPANFKKGANGNPVYTGPTTGCPPTTETSPRKTTVKPPKK
jgi:hypothetical protein